MPQRGPRELDSALHAPVAALLGDVRALLAIGVRMELAGGHVVCIEERELAGAPHEVAFGSGAGSAERAAAQRASSFTGALWRVDCTGEALQARLAFLRARLAPGSRVVLIAERRPAALRRLRAFVARERLEHPTLEELCGALLLAGLLLPRVHDEVAGYFILTAELPRISLSLDEVFAQPTQPLSR